MRILSVDIETLGLHPDSSVIEIGIVAFDETETLYSNSFLVVHREYKHVDPFAAGMHADKLKVLQDAPSDIVALYPNTVPVAKVADFFEQCLIDAGYSIGDRLRFAGKNFYAFDYPRLEKLGCFDRFEVSHRAIDVGNLYWQPEVDGDSLPNLQTCLTRAGFDNTVKHDALSDAKDVARLVQEYMNDQH